MKSIFRNIKPEVFFILAGLIFGTFFSIIIPYGAGFDEETHLVRIFDISGGHLIPNRPTSDGNYTFSEFFSLSYQRRPIQTPAIDNFSAMVFGQKPNWENMSSGHTESTYLPIMFFPEAIVAGLGWRVFNFPLLPVIIIMRIVGLVTYIGMCYFAVRIIPIGKWVLTVLLLAPMAMFQASTLNGDHFTIAASALFLANLIRILSKSEPIRRKEALILSVFVILIGIAKPGTIIILPALFLLIWKEFAAKSSPLLILFSAIISILISIYWSSMAVLFTTYLPSGATRADQIKLILSNFPDFVGVYFRAIFHLLPRFFTDWVAEYGYWVGKIPWPVYVFFVLSLACAYLTESNTRLISKTQRLALLILGIICLGIMASLKIIWNYVPGATTFETQGRYFLPFAPLVLLAFVGLLKVPTDWQLRAIIGSLIFLFASLTFYSYGMYRTYYTTCVFAVDANHPCVLPIYRNLETRNPIPVPLGLEDVITQTFIPECNQINAIDVQVLRIQQTQGSLLLNLYDQDENLVSQSKVDLSSLVENSQNSFHLTNIRVDPKAQYSFSLLIESESPAFINFWGIHDDLYRTGQVVINNSTVPQVSDLYFKYECSSN